MTNVQELELVLARMTELLRLGSHGNWGDALEKERSALSTEPTANGVQHILDVRRNGVTERRCLV